MSITIEQFLDLSPEEIEKRKGELVKTLPTRPGLEYLKLRIKEFDVEPWPFLNYLAYGNTELLSQSLDRYRNYNGNESVGVIMEKLKEYYIISQLIMIGTRNLKQKK